MSYQLSLALLKKVSRLCDIFTRIRNIQKCASVRYSYTAVKIPVIYAA